MLHQPVAVRSCSAAGFTLIETLIAVALLAGLAAGLAHLVVVARRAVSLGGADAVALQAATQKLEELRSLDWTFDPRTGRRVTDTTADLAQPVPSGRGPGLRASRAGAATLAASVPGYADHLDARGAWVAAAADEPSPGTAYVRPWAILRSPLSRRVTMPSSTACRRRSPAGAPARIRLRNESVTSITSYSPTRPR